MTEQGPTNRRRETIDDLSLLMSALPPDVLDAVRDLTDPSKLIEIVMDLGRSPEARFVDGEASYAAADVAHPRSELAIAGDAWCPTVGGR